MPLPASALALSIAAVTLVNLPAAYFLARAIGSVPDVPGGVVAVVFAAGILCAVLAVARWRRYVVESRAARRGP